MTFKVQGEEWQLERQERQCMCNVTLWCICVTTVAMKMQQRVPFVLLLTTCSCQHIKPVSVAMEMQECVPFCCCQDTKYFTLLSSI